MNSKAKIGENEKNLAKNWFEKLRDIICDEFEKIELNQVSGPYSPSDPGKFERKNTTRQGKNNQDGSQKVEHQRVTNPPALKVLRATADEEALHEARLARVKEEGGRCLWQDS